MVQSTLISARVYCIDTSALINIWRVMYPPDIFPGIQMDLEGLIDSAQLVAPMEVLNEIRERDDDLHKWARTHKKMFRQLTEIEVGHVRQILDRFPDLIDPDKTTPDADPFLIALASSRKWTVVTSERSGGSIGRPRIPDVCRHLNVRCISLMELFREQSWRYERG